MAKKREFQADKPHASLLDKLYITPKQRLSLLKWLLIGVILLILSVLQDVVLCRFRILGATTDLVPCARRFHFGQLQGDDRVHRRAD